MTPQDKEEIKDAAIKWLIVVLSVPAIGVCFLSFAGTLFGMFKAFQWMGLVK